MQAPNGEVVTLEDRHDATGWLYHHRSRAVCIGAFGRHVAQTRSLYDRLGGYSAISAVVDDFVKNVAADKRINKFFANANIDRLKVRLVEQICQGAGGPCVYTGRDMKSAHAGMGIRSKDFDALVQ